RIVHRDVKPSNVLFRSLPRERQEALRRDGKPVATERTLLGDFGIARRLEGLLGHTMVVGSPQYMAPEQADPARAASVDYRSDVYSAAVILYETLAGRVPFDIESPAGTFDGDAPRIEALRHDVPPPLADVLARGLDQDPSARFTSSWEWREALLGSLDGVPGGVALVTGTSQPEGSLIDLRPGHAAPEVDTVPIPVGAVSTGSAGGAGSTTPVATMKRTATLSDPAAVAAGPSPRAIGQFPPAPGEVSTVNVRVPGGFICAAGVAMLVSIFLPWGTVGSSAEGHVGAEFRSGALVAIEAVVLFLVGLRLWRTRRRWVASLLAGGASLGGLAGVGLACYELVRLGGPSKAQGLFLLLGASLVTAFAGYRAQGRLARMRRQERYPMLRAP
ncbi:MAG TPA: protein kinase, partial [Actinomycetota bacterium]|nr:protein kinase [Actinomycetota bacterium]